MMRRIMRRVLTLLLLLTAACDRSPAPSVPAQPAFPSAEVLARLAARVDPYVEKSRVVVVTDIANEPDDQMSMVRFLVYANEFDIEGLVAGTSTWMRNRVRPDVIEKLVDVYGEVR